MSGANRPRVPIMSGPRVDPHIIGGEPFTILAWEEWMQRAACLDIDPEIFYPEKGNHLAATQARKVCRGCPVQSDCLTHALERGERFGIWGGKTAKQRATMAVAS